MADDTDTPDDQSGTKGGSKGKRAADIIKECRERLKWAVTNEGDNRTAALDDLAFLVGDQWPENIKRLRALENSPCLTINTLPTFLHQVTNDQRQNKGAIKVHPVDDEADIETAKVLQGLIRHIEYASNADVAYDTAVGSAAANGFGYFRLVTEYESDTSFNQEIRFQRIRNPMTVYMGPHDEADGSDVKWVVISKKEKRDEYKAEYPDADMAGFDALSGVGDWADWCDDTDIRVAEYYRIKSEPCDVVLLSNGESGYKDKLVELPAGVTIVKTRKGQRKTVEWFKLSAVEILEETVIKCKWIPVFPVYGDEVDINGKVIRSGLIRHAKDSVRTHNYWMTSATAEVALRNKVPYIGAEGQFEGHPEWEDANNVPYAYLEYKPVSLDGSLAPPPQRQPMTDIPSGMLAMVVQTKQNIKDCLGMFNAAVGERGSATSGKQELAQQREADVGTFHYTDNLNRARNHAGRCSLSMIPHYYDTERAVRMLGEDDTATYAKINEPNTQQKPSKDGKVREVLNNLCAGTFDVTVAPGPSFTTQRTEAAEYLTQVASSAKDPGTSAVVTYLAVKNSDIPGAEDAAKMLERLLPPAAKDPPEDEEGQPMVQTPQGPVSPDQAGAMIAQMGQALQNASAQLDEAESGQKAQIAKVEAQRASDAERMDLERQKAVAQDVLDRERVDREMELKRYVAEQEAELARFKLELSADADIDAAIAKVQMMGEAFLAKMAQQPAGEEEQQAPQVDVAAMQAQYMEGLAQILQALTAKKRVDLIQRPGPNGPVTVGGEVSIVQ